MLSDEHFGMSPAMSVIDDLRAWNVLPVAEKQAAIRMFMPMRLLVEQIECDALDRAHPRRAT